MSKACDKLENFIARIVLDCDDFQKPQTDAELRHLAEIGDCQFNMRCGDSRQTCPIAKQRGSGPMPQSFFLKQKVMRTSGPPDLKIYKYQYLND